MSKPKNHFLKQLESLRNVPRFFAMIWQVSPQMTVANVLLRLVGAAIPLAMLWVGKIIIDDVVLISKNLDLGEKAGWMAIFQQKKLLWLVATEFGLVILQSLLGRAVTLIDSLLGDLVSNKTSVDLIKHAATLDLYQFENATFYDKLERARTQTTSRTVLMSMVLTQLQEVATVLFLAAGLIAFNPWLLGILALAVIPSFISETRFNRESYSLTRSWTPERRELDYLRFIGASDQTAKEVKSFGLENFLADRFEKIADRYYLANKNVAIRRAGWGAVWASIGTVAYYGAYVFIIGQAVVGLISLGSLTFLAGSFQRVQGLLQGIVSRFSRIAESSLYLQDLFDFFEIKPLIVNDLDKKLLSIPRPIKTGFRFENVSFKYPDSEKYAIKALTFDLRAGEKLALVGENGAGKTTLVKLLARLYEPTGGRILLDGRDLRDYDLADLRGEIGIIFQDFVKFQLKASENIAIGDIQSLDNQGLIENSAEKSLADAVIEPLPKKYETHLGKRFSGGVELSGGQWQKVALARAYMRPAQLFILDEPTAALDARAEHEVFVRFSELILGKTAVLISHRFSTVRMADRILFLENGQLLEIGSHAELVEHGGKYAELFRLQAKGYL